MLKMVENLAIRRRNTAISSCGIVTYTVVEFPDIDDAAHVENRRIEER